MELSQELALSLINSNEQFPIDFDQAWQWVGYAKKQNAKNKLINNFEPTLDYFNFTDLRVKSKQQGLQPGRPAQKIRLTIDCFKSFAMMAGTARGREVSRENASKSCNPDRVKLSKIHKKSMAIARSHNPLIV